MTARLFASTALSPHRNPYGLVVVVAETREEAVARARARLEDEHPTYAPHQEYAQNLLDNLEATMAEVDSGVIIDWGGETTPR